MYPVVAQVLTGLPEYRQSVSGQFCWVATRSPRSPNPRGAAGESDRPLHRSASAAAGSSSDSKISVVINLRQGRGRTDPEGSPHSGEPLVLARTLACLVEGNPWHSWVYPAGGPEPPPPRPGDFRPKGCGRPRRYSRTVQTIFPGSRGMAPHAAVKWSTRCSLTHVTSEWLAAGGREDCRRHHGPRSEGCPARTAPLASCG